MNTPARPPVRYPLAQRISQQLEQELGQGIDARRMLNEPLYARDVLLVCEARPGLELDKLARQFRQAPAFRMRDPEPAPSGGAPSTGFDSSRPDMNSDLPNLAANGSQRPPWYSPSRWLGR